MILELLRQAQRGDSAALDWQQSRTCPRGAPHRPACQRGWAGSGFCLPAPSYLQGPRLGLPPACVFLGRGFLSSFRPLSQTLAAEWLWQAAGGWRSFGLRICDCVFKHVCGYSLEVFLPLGTRGGLVTAGRGSCDGARLARGRRTSWVQPSRGPRVERRVRSQPRVVSAPQAGQGPPRHGQPRPAPPWPEEGELSSGFCWLFSFLLQMPIEWTAPRCWVKQILIFTSLVFLYTFLSSLIK